MKNSKICISFLTVGQKIEEMFEKVQTGPSDGDDDTGDEEEPEDHENILVQDVRRYLADELVLVVERDPSLQRSFVYVTETHRG